MEVAAGVDLNRCRIALEAPGLLTQPGVFGFDPREPLGRAAIVLPRLDRGDEPALAHERVRQQHAANEHQCMASTAVAPLALRERGRHSGVEIYRCIGHGVERYQIDDRGTRPE